MSDANGRQDDIDSVAATWVVRLHGHSLSDAERRDLKRWLDASPLHAAAFDEAKSAWSKMGELRDSAGSLALGRAAALDRGMASVATVQSRSWQRSRAPAAALAACLLLAIAVARLWLGDPLTLVAADHRTAPGMQDRVILADGSIVDLGPDSAVAVDFTYSERRVELLAGLAQFTAAPLGESETRPFLVTAADGGARALGTRFMVSLLAETTDVTVIEHAVEVALTRDDGEDLMVVVPAGRAVRYGEAGLGDVRSVNLDHATAWRRGRLIVDRMVLRDVIQHFGRYRRGWIVITDPGLASRRVSGVFDMTDPEAALATLIRDLGLGSMSVSPLITVLY